MNYLKKQKVEKCVSVLKAFIDGAHAGTDKKSIAALSLEQLHRVMAGGILEDVGCIETPRIYS
ncbi:MAG: hypothetical protein ACM3SY_08190 [Candidatus Omnitrophota bacterium]